MPAENGKEICGAAAVCFDVCERLVDFSGHGVLLSWSDGDLLGRDFFSLLIVDAHGDGRRAILDELQLKFHVEWKLKNNQVTSKRQLVGHAARAA